MKSSVLLSVLLLCLLGLVAATELAVEADMQLDPVALLNQPLAPPPQRRSRIAQLQQATQHAAASSDNNNNNNHNDHSFLAVSSTTTTTNTASSSASAAAAAQSGLQAKIASEIAAAVDESVLNAVSVDATVSAKGQLSAEEQLLVSRMIPIPKTSIPSDPAKPIEYYGPPTRDVLAKDLGPRGYPWEEKLQNALTTVDSTAQQKIGQIRTGMKWSKQANKLVGELNLKKQKVLRHVQKLTDEIKNLLGKKKQIQNKQLQDRLVERLLVTHANLKKLRRQTHNIRKNQAKMIHHKEELAHALEGIKRSLAILKGMKRSRQFPARGAGRKMEDELAKFDPDMSFEKEADEVRALQFPDAVLAEVDADADAEQQEEPALMEESEEMEADME